ncbi:MAG: hypothetical protein Q8K45_14915 [Rubrivivax sp.]|nr:hypothetical protein [Rubrivivax sp.]
MFEMSSPHSQLSWQFSFRTLGFAKDQIDGAMRYRHPLCTEFGWQCLLRFAGRRWDSPIGRFAKERFSAGFPIALVAGWRSNHTFDNRGLEPDESARAVARDVQAHVLPFIAKLDSDKQLMHFLVKDEEPYRWFRSQGLSRLAEIAKLEAALDVRDSILENLASTHKQMLEDQLDEVSLEAYVECIRNAARSDA